LNLERSESKSSAAAAERNSIQCRKGSETLCNKQNWPCQNNQENLTAKGLRGGGRKKKKNREKNRKKRQIKIRTFDESCSRRRTSCNRLEKSQIGDATTADATTTTTKTTDTKRGIQAHAREYRRKEGRSIRQDDVRILYVHFITIRIGGYGKGMRYIYK